MLVFVFFFYQYFSDSYQKLKIIYEVIMILLYNTIQILLSRIWYGFQIPPNQFIYRILKLWNFQSITSVTLDFDKHPSSKSWKKINGLGQFNSRIDDDNVHHSKPSKISIELSNLSPSFRWLNDTKVQRNRTAAFNHRF